MAAVNIYETETWTALNRWLRTAAENDVASRLRMERRRKAPRASYLRRLHERLNWLRFRRERGELGIPETRQRKGA